MLYKTLSAAVYGIDANIIEVEVDISGIKTNEDHFHTVGLPDAAVRESRSASFPKRANLSDEGEQLQSGPARRLYTVRLTLQRHLVRARAGSPLPSGWVLAFCCCSTNCSAQVVMTSSTAW